MGDITWALKADFDRDSTYEATLTEYVTKPGAGVAIDRGMGPDGFMRTSKMTVGLNNADGRLSPRTWG